MSYINVYPSRINWENEPSIASPINATNLNKIDYAVYEHDRTFGTWDITKANQSDLLLSLKDVSYDTDTGVFVFTWWNGTTQTVDLNIEKIPVSFSMSSQGVITMTTDDGTQYTADVGSLIKTYTFNDSSVIDFTVVTDADGNKTVTADIVDGSITGQKLQPNYLADCEAAKTDAENAADAAEDSSEDAEAWAVGERGGVPVPSTDPAYENNSKYWAQHTSSSLAGLTDTDITNPQDGDVLTYDGTNSLWKNGTPSAGGGSKVVVSTAESSLYGETVTLSDGVTTLSATFDNAGVATFQGVTITGNLTVSASAGGQTATTTVNVPYFGNYTAALAFFSATITVTYPANGTCTITDGVTTLNASSNPMAFNIPNTGTWTATAIVDGVSKNGTAINITTDGQTASDTIQFGTINVTYADDFKGISITCTSGGTTITKTAPAAGSTMVFYPPTTGTWTVSGTVGGQAYPVDANVTSLSTPVSVTLETIPEGSTVTPVNDIQIWLKCAGITGKSYTTINQVLADSTTLLALISNNNAVDYMVRSTSWATSVCGNSTAMTDIGANNYCANKLLANSTWCTAICNSTYFESVLNVKVPTMTSNTTPSGECIASTSITQYPPFQAFDGNDSTIWAPTAGGEQYVGYVFPQAVKIFKIRCLVNSQQYPYRPWDIIGKYSDNGTSWTNATTTSPGTAQISDTSLITTVTTAHRYWAVFCLNYSGTENTNTVQFYGRKDV